MAAMVFFYLLLCTLALAAAQSIVAPEPNPGRDLVQAICEIVRELRKIVPQDKIGSFDNICPVIYY